MSAVTAAAGAVTATLLLTAAVACGSPPGSIAAHGSIELSTAFLSGQTPDEAFPDVAPGGQVTVVDASGRVIGTGTLRQSGKPSIGLLSADILTFTVTVPNGEVRYGVQIGHDRGTVWFTQRQMQAGPHLSLSG